MKLVALSVAACVLLAQAQEIRIDQFDTKSRRTGYIIINPTTGRVDAFDTRSNRLGYGTAPTPRPDSRGSTLPTDRRTK